MGPRPASRTAPRRSMSKSRTALLDTLRGQPQPTTLAALTSATGLHPNTLREHLDALVKLGLVRRHRAEPQGRGRPAWLYDCADDEGAGEPSEYAGLAAALASAISRNSDSPREDAIVAGTEWGHQLARGFGAPPTGREKQARRQVVELLEEIGFAPDPDARNSVVRLTRCPLLEAAHQYPEIVCGVHLGIVRGAVEEYGADPTGTDLLPFSEPGACRLDLVAHTTSQPR